MLAGNLGARKETLRDYIRADSQFEALSAATGTPPKSPRLMFRAHGNPLVGNLFVVLGTCSDIAAAVAAQAVEVI